jgi:hypothetical protein
MATNKLKLASWALGLCVLLGATACDDESTDSPDSGAEGGRVSRAGSGGKGGAGGKGGESGDAGSKDEGGSGGKGGAGGSGSGDDECFDGEPEEVEQFLNRCTDSECEAFDNAERLPLLEDGKLPPLP